MNTIKIFFITIIISLVMTQAKSQSVYEFGIKFTNDTVATLVGADGTIMYTSDGGLSWTQQESNTTNVLYCTDVTYKVYSVTSPIRIPIGITVGENGMILRTINGGIIWYLVESGTQFHLRGVSSNLNTQSVSICGDNGTILYSSDAGETFSQMNSKTNANLYAISYSPDLIALNRLEARKVLAIGDNGTIIMSGDDGITWEIISTSFTDNLKSISWADPYTAVVVGENGAIYNTTDRGYTWTSSFSEFTGTFYGVKYLDANTAIAVGDSGKIMRTMDNGHTWKSVESNTTNSIMSVNFANNNRGIAVGEESTTLYTEDGGTTWNTRINSPKNNISPVVSKNKKFHLSQNYPNPFNPSTTISYNLTEDSKVSLKVYDLAGKEVASLINTYQTKGIHSINFNAKNLTSGIYFYRIEAGTNNEVKKMILLK